MPAFEHLSSKAMKPTLFFLDGTLPGPGNLALAAQYNDNADVDASRLLLRIAGDWVKVDFDDDVIRSLSFESATGTLHLLGTSGTMYTIGGRDPRFTKATIKGTLARQQAIDPEERGELFRVRSFGHRTLACGQGGQVLERIAGQWVSIGLQGPALECPDFEDIALDGHGRPVAVGSKGAIVRFDAAGPQRLDSPTNQHLSSMAVDAAGRCFACGNAGTVIEIGDAQQADLSLDLAEPRNLWAVACRPDALYVCEPARLLKRAWRGDGSWQVEPVSTAPAPSFYRLVSDGDELWSFGADHVFVQRAGQWTRLPVPGNEIPP